MALEIGRLISYHRIADGVGLVKGVVGKVVDFVVNSLGRGLGNSVCDAALDAPLRIAVDEGVALLFNLLGLFLGDGTAHHICLAQRVPAQLLENLYDLLLIDNASIGHGQNWLQGRVLIGDEPGVLLAGDKAGDGIHGARTV